MIFLHNLNLLLLVWLFGCQFYCLLWLWDNFFIPENPVPNTGLELDNDFIISAQVEIHPLTNHGMEALVNNPIKSRIHERTKGIDQCSE